MRARMVGDSMLAEVVHESPVRKRGSAGHSSPRCSLAPVRWGWSVFRTPARPPDLRRSGMRSIPLPHNASTLMNSATQAALHDTSRRAHLRVLRLVRMRSPLARPGQFWTLSTLPVALVLALVLSGCGTDAEVAPPSVVGSSEDPTVATDSAEPDADAESNDGSRDRVDLGA